MKKVNFFTLLFLATTFSFSCLADSDAYRSLMDVERVEVLRAGKELSYVLKPGMIIGDCIIRRAKFYSDHRYTIVLRKTTGNALSNKFNRDHEYTLSNPSWFSETAKTKILTNRQSGKALYGMFYSTLSVKVQKSKKNGMKVSELTIKTSRLNKDLKTTQDDYSSIRCINKKAENTTSHTW